MGKWWSRLIVKRSCGREGLAAAMPIKSIIITPQETFWASWILSWPKLTHRNREKRHHPTPPPSPLPRSAWPSWACTRGRRTRAQIRTLMKFREFSPNPTESTTKWTSRSTMRRFFRKWISWRWRWGRIRPIPFLRLWGSRQMHLRRQWIPASKWMRRSSIK